MVDSNSLIPSLRRLFISVFLFVISLPILAKILFFEEAKPIEIQPDQVKYPKPQNDEKISDEKMPDSYEIEELLTTKTPENDSEEPWPENKVKFFQSKWKSFQGMENPKYKTQKVAMNHYFNPPLR